MLQAFKQEAKEALETARRELTRAQDAAQASRRAIQDAVPGDHG